MDSPVPGKRYGLPERRNSVIELLVQAYADGQIDLEDYESRVDLANRAETIDELQQVIHDFPEAERNLVGWSDRTYDLSAESGSFGETKIAIIGDHKISHEDFAGHGVRSIALIGDVKVHLEHAPPVPRPYRLSVFNLIGDTTVHIPRGMRVKNRVVNILGDVEIRRNEDSAVDETRGICIIEGFSLIGDITIVEDGYRKKGFFKKLVDR